MPDSAPKTPRRHLQPLAVGGILADKYTIVGVLGEGGTGIVYDALSPEKTKVALKVIHGHLLSDAQIRGRFTREAKILRRLSGPHLCPVLEFGEAPDPLHEDASVLFLALERVDGPALDQVLRESGPLDLDRIYDLVLQMLDGLASAHAQGVIHRDLKPANVLLAGGSRVIIVDFGMAKIVTGGGTGTTNLTAHNMVFGTPEYMAPEQARGDELDARCDVYAVGIILYEMLTGRVPFSATTPLGVLTAQLTSDVIPPRTKAPTRPISAALEAVTMSALAKDPMLRYSSATALASALQRAKDAPDDVAAVSPEHFGRQSLMHAQTTPAPEPGVPSRPAPISVRASARTPTPVPAPQRTGGSRAIWTMVWVAAVALGIAIGVWLSLRTG